MPRAAYEFRAVGDLPPHLLDDFDGASVLADPAGSTIHVVLRDEAELHGLLDAMSRAGVELLDMRRDPVIEPGQDEL